LLDAEKYQTLYEKIKVREDQREAMDIKNRTLEEIQKRKELYSLVGHIKTTKTLN